MRLSFYIVNPDYCGYLRQCDPCVSYNSYSKENRPFVGIVLQVNGFDYFAPLSSPKNKHLKMKNQIDFIKIEGGRLGVINFNNMIPVPCSCLTKVDMKVRNGDSKTVIDYKNLLSNQLSWCNSNKATIISQAEKLYKIITQNKAWPALKERCCDFVLDEKRCLEYK